MFSKLLKKEIIRHDENNEFIDLWCEVQRKYPEDIEKQLELFRKQENAQFRLLGEISLIQGYLARNLEQKIDTSTNELEFLFRSLLDLARHAQKNLPDGVHDYNFYNLDLVVNNILKKVEDNNANKGENEYVHK